MLATIFTTIFIEKSLKFYFQGVRALRVCLIGPANQKMGQLALIPVIACLVGLGCEIKNKKTGIQLTSYRNGDISDLTSYPIFIFNSPFSPSACNRFIIIVVSRVCCRIFPYRGKLLFTALQNVYEIQDLRDKFCCGDAMSKSFDTILASC